MEGIEKGENEATLGRELVRRRPRARYALKKMSALSNAAPKALAAGRWMGA